MICHSIRFITNVIIDSVKTEQVPGGADSVLRLARVNSSDAGNYTCAVRGARPHTVAVHVLNGNHFIIFLLFKNKLKFHDVFRIYQGWQREPGNLVLRQSVFHLSSHS